MSHLNSDFIYFPVPSNLLFPLEMCAVDIFVEIDGGFQVIVEKGAEISVSQVNLLRNAAVFVRDSELNSFYEMLESNLNNVIDSDMSLEDKSQTLYSVATERMKSLFQSPFVIDDQKKKEIQSVKKSVEATLDFLSGDPDSFKKLLRITYHDYYTYTHSVNVGIYSTILASRLGFDAETMKRLAFGFFLHDLGKVHIPLGILNKNGKLSDDEWKAMKAHPYQGYKILKDLDILTEEAKVIVLEHHEKFDGKGYPRGLTGKEIHPYAKICAIADVFDALTTKRSYKAAIDTFEALKIMKETMLHQFDREMFVTFVKILSEK